MKILVSIILTVFLVNTSFAQEQYLSKGNAYINKRNLDSAEFIFKTAIKADSTKLVYQEQLGLVFIEQHKYKEAEAVLTKVLQKDSTNAAALWYSGVAYFKSQEYKQSIAHFEKALPHVHPKSG